MHILPSAKLNFGKTIPATLGMGLTDLQTLFINNGHEILIQDNEPAILDLRVSPSSSAPWILFVISTDGLIWIMDTTAKDGVLPTQLVFKASWLRPSHLLLLLNTTFGKIFLQTYLDTVLITDTGVPATLSQLFDYHLDLNEVDKYLSTALERFLVETQVKLIEMFNTSRNDLYVQGVGVS